jgi:hypothetical protein
MSWPRIGTSSEADGTQTNRTSDKLSHSLALSLSLFLLGVFITKSNIYICACILPSTLAPDVNYECCRMLAYADVC